MGKYAVYDEVSKEVHSILLGAPPIPQEIPSGFATLEVEGDFERASHYIDGELVVRPRREISWVETTLPSGEVEITLSEWEGLSVTFPRGITMELVDDTILFATDETGEYTLRVKGDEVRDTEITVNATAIQV